MAIHVEDHPVSYGGFEGTIPKGHYGAGNVVGWDRGTWEPVGDPRAGMEAGKLIFKLHGEKLAGLWELVRISKADDKQDRWLLLKKRGDAWARPAAEYDVISALPDSVVEHPLGPVEEREPRTSLPSSQKTREPDLANAKKAPLPKTLSPQLATLVDAAPSEAGWSAETKFDGYRILCRIDRGAVRLLTRSGLDWTDKMPALAESLQQLHIDRAWLDGEIVVPNDDGVPDFNALQNAMDSRKSEAVVYYLFGVPFLGDYDLRRVPLWSRKLVLQRLLEAGDVPARVRFSQSLNVPGGQLLQAACQLGLEGLILKQEDAPTCPSAAARGSSSSAASARSSSSAASPIARVRNRRWAGCCSATTSTASCVTPAASAPDGARRRAKRCIACWSRWRSRSRRSTSRSSRAVVPADEGQRTLGEARSGRGGVVQRVDPDGHIRHPSFKGVRSDKPASMITREPVATAPAAAPAAKASKAAAPSTSVKLIGWPTSARVHMLRTEHDYAIRLDRQPFRPPQWSGRANWKLHDLRAGGHRCGFEGACAEGGSRRMCWWCRSLATPSVMRASRSGRRRMAAAGRGPDFDHRETDRITPRCTLARPARVREFVAPCLAYARRGDGPWCTQRTPTGLMRGYAQQRHRPWQRMSVASHMPVLNAD
jgi:bifunctional non-homologous end joining protein LigD